MPLHSHFPTFAWLIDCIPHKVAAGVTAGGAVVAVAAQPVGGDTSTVGYAGLATIVVGGIVSIYKIYADASAGKIHRDELDEKFDRGMKEISSEMNARLGKLETRQDLMYAAVCNQQRGESLSHSLEKEADKGKVSPGE